MQDVSAWLEGLRTRVLTLVVRGLVKRARYTKEVEGEEETATKGVVQLLQIEGLKGEVLSDVEHPQPYGFASRVRDDANAECVAFSLGGDRSRTVVLVTYDRKVGFKLKPGEAALFDDQGQWVRLHQDGRISLKANGEVRVAGPSARLVVQGEVEADGKVKASDVEDANPNTPTMQSMRILFNSHTHFGTGPPQQQM